MRNDGATLKSQGNGVTCPVCSKETQTLIKGSGTSILKCFACELRFVDPFPSEDDIAAYYNGMYKPSSKIVDENRIHSSVKTIEAYNTLVVKLRKEPVKRMLDYGGGLGYFCKAAEVLGIEATLADPDPISVSFAKEKLKVSNAILMPLGDNDLEFDRKFDFILLRHVIEHVSDPESILMKCKSLLCSKGIILIETDNNDSIELMLVSRVRRFYTKLYQENFANGNMWDLIRLKPFAIDPPRHLFSFRISNLRILLERLNMKMVYARSYNLGDELYWPNITMEGLSSFTRALYSMKARHAYRILLDLILTPLRRALSYYKKGAGIQLAVMNEEDI